MYKLLIKYTKDGWWAAILGPLFVILEVVFDTIIPYLMSLIIDTGITQRGGDIDYIVRVGGMMVVCAILAGITGALSGVFASIASCRFIRNVRTAIMEKIQTYDFRNIEKFPVPTIVMRTTTDMRMLRMAYVSIVRMLVRTPLNIIMSAYMAIKLNKSLAAIFVVVIPVLGTGLALMIILSRPRFIAMMHRFDDLNGQLKENIEDIRVVKSFVREEHEKEKFSLVSWMVTKAQRYAETMVIYDDAFFQFVMYACMIAVCWIGGNHIITGSMTSGAFMSFLAYLKAILMSLMGVSMGIMQVVMANASVSRANEVLSEIPDIDDSNADPELQVENGNIEFRNVSFKYSKHAEKNTLSDININIRSGEVIGILGPTGGGKSTFAQLIDRLYEISEGEILVGGHNIKEYKLHNLREAVSMVLQKNTLFSGTIEENMKWGNPEATHEEAVEACRIAQADDFIMSFPKQYESELGQGGSNVSGGQKQRLCIARALLKKPKIIILDDSTSAVDTDTDHRIQLALKEKLGNMTTIIIAQRVSSVKEANRIIIMNEGKIEDIGSHDELLERNTVYRDLYETQMKGVQE